MKISKLFHWLYAFLMFLPVTFLLPSLLYFGLNDNAIAQEYTKEEPVYYETNEVNSISDLVSGNIYTITFSENMSSIVGLEGRIILDDYFVINSVITNNAVGSNNFPVPNILVRDSKLYLYHTQVDNASASRYLFTYCIVDIVFRVNFDFDDLVGLISSCPRQHIKEYQEVTYTMGITESINQSILDTFDLPMFSWTSDNFIIAPFNYITNLFGLPNGNVVNKYLDYWLSISIIYLCFDVIMYVPLLVHRWLDKGIVE